MFGLVFFLFFHFQWVTPRVDLNAEFLQHFSNLPFVGIIKSETKPKKTCLTSFKLRDKRFNVKYVWKAFLLKVFIFAFIHLQITK